MAKQRKTENPDEVIKWMNPDMEDETTSGKGDDEDLEVTPEGVGIGGFTNSPLVSYTKLSPFKNSPRNQPISKIIIHHTAGVVSVESFGAIVTAPGREMSANYAIGNDGRIGLYCPEEDRCWCSSSAWVDHRGIAIEVSNSKLGEPWPISKKAWDSMIALCADICKRNNIPKMTYTGDKDGVLCFHRWFAATGCVPIDTTEVLTPDGWVPLRDIQLGDTIAIASPKDFSIRFDKVENMTEVHKDTVFNLRGMDITKEHRVLYSTGAGDGYRLGEYQKIVDGQDLNIPEAGSYDAKGMDITSSQMIFLLEMQRIGLYDDEFMNLEFSYISEQQMGYMDGLLKNLGYKYIREQGDLGPVRFIVTDPRASTLCQSYLSGHDFNWKWLEMNPTQFSYFIYKATSHVDTGWTRRYVSNSMVNIDIVQALCALNGRGTEFDPATHSLYVKDGYRTVSTKDITTTDEVDVACVTVKTGCFLMRQHGRTTLTGNCPGEYIFSRAQQICDEVNAKLAEMPEPEPTPDPEPVPVTIKPGVLVSLVTGAKYYNGAPIPAWVLNQRWFVTSFSGDRVVLGKNEAGNADINSPVQLASVRVVQNASAQPTNTFTPYLVRLKAGTYIYGDDKKKVVGQIKVATAYTIVKDDVINGVKFGALKSGAGWINLGTDNTNVDLTINPGDTVSVKDVKNGSAATYEGGQFKVYEKTYKVLRVNGDRVVISSDGTNVTAAVKAGNLIKK